MLDDILTLSVDVLNDGNATNQDFDRTREYDQRSVYQGPNHSMISQDTLTFYVTEPKKAGNFNGVAKAAATFREDKTVPGADPTTSQTGTLIGGVSFNIPVGVVTADLVALRQRMIALLDDDAFMAKLCEKQQI